MTLIGPGTWEAARAAVDAALTAAELVLDGAPAAYACVRPPGHHADASCVRRLLLPEQRGRRGGALAAPARPVAVLDVDAHHGNGTQAIFYDRDDVLVGSVHVDPGAGWFPHFLGFADETGAGAANRNVPLAPGTGDEAWLAAVARPRRLGARQRAAALVVSLGVDAAAATRRARSRSRGGFREAGRAARRARAADRLRPGGRLPPGAIGALVRETLLGFEAAR